jgi:deoxyhypusine monooxygenase
MFHDKSVCELKEILLDVERSLFERYGAMFTLRDRGTEECVEALGAGFGDKSILFRHEIGE